MDGLRRRCVISLLTLVMASPGFAAGYFQLHNLMTLANKTIPSNIFFNDNRLTLQNQERGSGHVVNTQFSNDGGMAGCGVTSTLIEYMYKNTGTVDLSKNYIALNVYSQVMGFNPDAPYWGNPEGQLKGYLTQGASTTHIAYPYIPYHRAIPGLYPAYGGLWNNGLNCGRWLQANFDTTHCLDRTTDAGVSKSCPTINNLTYAGGSFKAYVFDSCEDNNGWCRDDEAHIDINPMAFSTPDNYYLQWKFISNPYYLDAKAPAYLKDVWLAWFVQASRYWSYVAILNTENGLSDVQYNIGSLISPTWIHSHVLGGDNNMTWASGSNNGQLWQVEPVNSLTDSVPPTNPFYQMRMFDYLGYPARQGSIYQFQLMFQDGTLGQQVDSFSLFYKGGLPVKSGSQTQNMTILRPPVGTGSITVGFGSLLPSMVSLDKTAANYLRPVLISSDGYSWDAAQCLNGKCVFTKLPLSGVYHVFAHAMDEPSNDLTLRMVNDVSVSSANITFPAGTSAITYTLKPADINLSTLYSSRIAVPLKFATTSTTALNGNLQALFVPDATKNGANISATTQGCFLNNYIKSFTSPAYFGNSTICTVYYTVNHQAAFTGNPPSAWFNVVLPKNVGFAPVNYVLSGASPGAVQVTGYNPASGVSPVTKSVPQASYVASSSSTRSIFWILDPGSDSRCLQHLDRAKGVSLTLGNGAMVTLTQVGLPVESQIGAGVTSVTAVANLDSGAGGLSCQGMSALVVGPTAALKPGIDVVDVIRLVAVPASVPPPSATQGILVSASGDAACLGVADTLTFTSNGTVAATAAYTPQTTASKIGLTVAPGSYSVKDVPFNVPGGTCQIAGSPVVQMSSNTFTPLSLPYQFTKTAGSTCAATASVQAAWPGGCTVAFSLKSASPLSHVSLAWAKGNWNWTTAQPWVTEGSLAVPAAATGNVVWALPAWVNGQGSVVGMNVINDGAPSLCSAFSAGSITVACSGVVS